MYNITLGSDPEIFVENKKGEVVSAIGLIQGTKDEPFPISENGHMIQIDNVAMEFNIPPCHTEDEFVENIMFVKDYLSNIAESNNLVLSNKASYSLHPDELLDPISQVFGCDPDFDPYDEVMNEPPSSEDPNLRSVGGHVHIGYDNPNAETTISIVKAFDMFCALPAMLIDTDNRRRELYGKAGSFRFKEPWGLECRVLSNFWIHDESLIRWVYQKTIKAVTLVLSGEYEAHYSKFENEVRAVINSNDVKGAKKLIAKIENSLVKN